MVSWRSFIRRVGRGGRFLVLFLHLTIINFTAVLPLLGAASTSTPLTAVQIGALLGVAFFYHVFAYVLNDVIDLPIDKTQPSRADYPLVRSLIQPRTAFMVALCQIPLAFLMTNWMGGTRPAFIWLGAAFVGIAIYDVWGKRTAVPPLSDFVQGVAWAALVWYGATVSGEPTWLTWHISAYVLLYIMLVNGVNASLRDLVNDIACGARTTAIWLGARPSGAGQMIVPFRLRAYALAHQACLIWLTLWPMQQKMFGYNRVVWLVTLSFMLFLGLVNLLTLLFITRPLSEINRVRPLFMTHIILMLLKLLMLLMGFLTTPLRLVVGLVFVAPLLTSDWLQLRVKIAPY